MLCDLYRQKSAGQRKQYIESHHLCLNCLGKHLVGECQSKKNCAACQGRYHTSIHDAYQESNASASSHVAQHPSLEQGTVLLATARVCVEDRFGDLHLVRALIDQGSEASMISEALVQRLRLPRGPAAIAVFGVGGKKSSVAKGSVSLRVWPRANGPAMTVSALILPRLTTYAGVPTLQRSSWNHLRGLELADPEFEAGDSVDILLGAEVYATGGSR